jgi:enoyl-[acyl-carrier protein] reductase II
LFTGRLRDAITVFHVVGTLAARKAADAGVDGLVVEGVEGGGFKNRFGASAWCCCRWSPSMSICR